MQQSFDYGDPVARWLVTEAFGLPDIRTLIEETAIRLAAALPLYRVAYFQRTPHPELLGHACFWRRGQAAVRESAPHSLVEDQTYRESPLYAVFERREMFRHDLKDVGPDAPQILRMLVVEGATDYVVLPVLFSTGHVDAISLVSDAAGGFAPDQLDRLLALLLLLARILEIHSLRETAANLLDAYVGHAAGQRILAGTFRRGEGRTVDAVIWYCDLRGFTRLTDARPREVVMALLDDFYGCMAGAVVDHGGEVLKFIGDAVLAMFQIDGDAPAAAARAIAAAADAEARVATLNGRRALAGEEEIAFGLALHCGEVMFGNVGGAGRLDFTIIGAAVNHAARLEQLCRVLGRPVLVSGALAALAGDGLVPLGRHQLRDVPEPQEVFGLPPAKHSSLSGG